MQDKTARAKSIKLREIMKKDIITINSDSSAGEAAKLMLKNKIHGLCVVDPSDNSRIKYVVTSFDILGLTYFGRFSEDSDFINSTRIEKLVEKQKLISFSPDQTVEEALKAVAEKNIRTLPVLDNNRLVGVVSIFDLVKAVLSL